MEGNDQLKSSITGEGEGEDGKNEDDIDKAGADESKEEVGEGEGTNPSPSKLRGERRNTARFSMLRRIGRLWPGKPGKSRPASSSLHDDRTRSKSHEHVSQEKETPTHTPEIVARNRFHTEGTVPIVLETHQHHQLAASMENLSEEAEDSEGENQVEVSETITPQQHIDQETQKDDQETQKDDQETQKDDQENKAIPDLALDFVLIPSEPAEKNGTEKEKDSHQSEENEKDNPLLGDMQTSSSSSSSSSSSYDEGDEELREVSKLRKAVEKEISKITQRNEMLSDEFAEKRDRAASETVEALASSVQRGDVIEEDDLEKSTLTPSQIALLYTTLQCADSFATSSSKSIMTKVKIGNPETSQRVQTRLGSEKLVLSHAYGALLRGQNVVTSFADNGAPSSTNRAVGHLLNLHEETVYPQQSTSKRLKEAFWNRCATRIQSTWRAACARKKFHRQRLERRSMPVSTLDRFHQTSHHKHHKPRPASGGSLYGSPRIQELPQSPMQRLVMENRFAALHSDRGEKDKEEGMEEGQEEEKVPSRALSDGEESSCFDYVMGKADRDMLLRLFETLRKGAGNQALTVSGIVSVLRRCRVQVSKSDFDLVLDRVIKGLLRCKDVNHYEPLSPTAFIDGIVQKAIGRAGNSLGDDMLDLAYRFESLSTRGLNLFLPTLSPQHTDYDALSQTMNGKQNLDSSSADFEQASSLTAHEVRLLHRLFLAISGGEASYVQASKFFTSLEKLAGLDNKISNKIYESYKVSHVLPEKMKVQDFVNFVQLQNKFALRSSTAARFVNRVLHLALQVDELGKHQAVQRKVASSTPASSSRARSSSIGSSRSLGSTSTLSAPQYSPFPSLKAQALLRAQKYHSHSST